MILITNILTLITIPHVELSKPMPIVRSDLDNASLQNSNYDNRAVKDDDDDNYKYNYKTMKKGRLGTWVCPDM